MAATIRDVAAEAGVAASTVSRVLNGRDDAWVSDATRQRITDAAERLGYRSNPFASGLRSGRAPVIVFILGMQTDQAMATKAWSLHESVTRLKHEVLTTHIAGPKAVERIRDLLQTIRPAAVTWLHPGLNRQTTDLISELHRDGIPVLLMDCPTPPPADLPCDALIVNREEGARLATGHLIEQGHRRIGTVATSDSTRMRGYLAALAEAGIDEQFCEALYGAATPVAGESATRRLMSDHPDLTALFCHSDLVAIGVMKALQDLDYDTPADVALASFDDDPWAGFLPVPLTTLSHPVDELCGHTEELLRERLEGGDGPFKRIDLPPRLVVRASSTGLHHPHAFDRDPNGPRISR